MKSFLPRALLVLLFAALSAGVSTAQSSDNHTPLTNAAVVKLVRAGFKEKTIISIVWARPPAYDLSPDRMIELKRNGVSEKIILAMLSRQEGGVADDDFWGDDPFLDQGSKQKQKENPGGTGKENSTDIFGSSGGSRGNTQTKGGNSSVSGETETTGSATVRIIRPPSEAGAKPKLEKMSSLTNNSIVDLVEAGFSEGTIIRRIEQSPVEFDLSPAKLADLRKHRVSDKILAAMKAAMGEESGTSMTGPPISDGTPKPN